MPASSGHSFAPFYGEGHRLAEDAGDGYVVPAEAVAASGPGLDEMD